jgi:hypothetical protein
MLIYAFQEIMSIEEIDGGSGSKSRDGLGMVFWGIKKL